MQRPVGRPAGRGFGCLAVWTWRPPASAWWGVRSVRPSARRAVTQMAATNATAQTGAPEAATQAVAPLATEMRATVTRVEAARPSRILGVRELVTA